MLKSLSIRNYALIDELELSPSKAFTTITGETGAGKSIMLGALGLLLGNRADTRSLLDTDKKCIIEGVFVIPEALKSDFESWELDFAPETIIRREILPSGKSRAFVNDTPAQLSILKNLGDQIIDIHSQHDHLLVTKNDFQLNFIDAIAANEGLIQQYQAEYKAYKKLTSELNKLVEQSRQLNKDNDYDQFLLNELNEAALDNPEEKDELEEELRQLENAEEILTKLGAIKAIMDEGEWNLTDNLQQVVAEISKLSSFGKTFEDLHQRMESLWIELKDLSSQFDDAVLDIELNDERLQEVQDRLSLIYKLEAKHNVEGIAALISIRDTLDTKLADTSSLDQRIEKLTVERDEKYAQVADLANKLTASRTQTFDTITESLKQLISPLGMPKGTFAINHEKTEPGVTGQDQVSFLFSANQGHKMLPLGQGASGGEISRVMFAIKYMLAGKTELPAIIFDEIDTGVSGEIAFKMASMMREMAQKHQVIAITHLPQIAAKGNKHYFVYKEDTQSKTLSRIKEISGDDRVSNIASMIGGANPSSAALDSARELLSL